MTTCPAPIDASNRAAGEHRIDGSLDHYASAAVATAGLGGAWVVGRGVLPFDVSCPILAIVGVPCPFCGITRLSEHLLRLDLSGAITQDPAGVLFLVVLGLLAVAGLTKWLGWSPRRWPAATPIVAILLTALGAHWATTLAGGGFVAG